MGRLGLTMYALNMSAGVDAMNCWFYYLSILLLPLYLFIGWFESSLSPLISSLILVCLICFTTTNLLLFVFYFELTTTLILSTLLLKSHSSYRVKSCFVIFLYSSMGSLLLSLPLLLFPWSTTSPSLHWFGLSFIIAASIKIPTWPFHHWLCIVHSEASTSTSLILASIIIKLGIYAVLRFALLLFAIAILTFHSTLSSTSTIGIVSPFLDLLTRFNHKILIALSSVTHMNMTSLSMLILNLSGIAASIVTSVSHGLSSVALFLFAGLLINKSLSHYIDSLWYLSTGHRSMFLAILLSSLNMPLSLSFIGEILALLSILLLSPLISSLLILSSVIQSIMLFLFHNRAIILQSFIFNLSIAESLLISFFAVHNFAIGIMFLL